MQIKLVAEVSEVERGTQKGATYVPYHTHPDVPSGEDDSENRASCSESRLGSSYLLKGHTGISEKPLRHTDFERAAKIWPRFTVYKGIGARLESCDKLHARPPHRKNRAILKSYYLHG